MSMHEILTVETKEKDHIKGFSDALLGVSFAATWTWAAAMLVGVAIMKEAGIVPFFLWFCANVAAIPFFGWISRKYPGLWNQTRRVPMRVFMTINLMFTLWFNMTGIQNAGKQTGWFSSGASLWLIIIPILTGLIVWIYTFHGGIRWSVISDRVQWALELGSMVLIMVAVLVESHGFHVQPTLKIGLDGYNTLRGLFLGFWTIPLLLSNPFLDATFWHRARYARSMKPYWWGFGMFLAYLSCVAVVALVGLTPVATIILFAVIFFASFSTLDSCTAALQLTGTKKIGNWIGLGAIFGWLLVSAWGLLDVWALTVAWYPILFGWQIVTYQLEKRGILGKVDPVSLAARDALPLIEGWSDDPAASAAAD